MVGRSVLLQMLKERLCSGNAQATAALSSLPGVGKTPFAAEMVQDADLLASFPDEILWAGLGPAPNVLGLLDGWAAALGLPTHEANRASITELGQTLHDIIGRRRMLLILDDAWHIAAAR